MTTTIPGSQSAGTGFVTASRVLPPQIHILKRAALCFALLLAITTPLAHPLRGAEADSETRLNHPAHQQALRKLLTQYCIHCHGSETAEADLNFTRLLEPEGFARDRKLWESCVIQIQEENMPPEGEMPSGETRRIMADAIRDGLKNVDWEAIASAGDVPLPRLTSLEYAHTLQDVIGLPVPLNDLLPLDLEGASGFANDRAGLLIGEVEMRGFLLAAERAAQAAVTAAAFRNTPQEIFLRSTEGRSKYHNPGYGTIQFGDAMVTEFDRHWHMKDQKLYHEVEIDHPGIYRITVRAATNLAGDGSRRYVRNLGLGMTAPGDAIVTNDAPVQPQANETVIADFEEDDSLDGKNASHVARFNFVDDVPPGSKGRALKTVVDESAGATNYFGTGFAIPETDLSTTGQISFWIRSDMNSRFNIQLHSAGNRVSILPFSTVGSKGAWQKVSAPIAAFDAASWAGGAADLRRITRFQVTAFQNGPFDGRFVILDNVFCGPRTAASSQTQKTPSHGKGARGALSFTINDSAPDQSPGVVIEGDELREYTTFVYLDKGVQEIGIAHEELRVPFVEAPPEEPLTPLPKEQFTRDSGQVPVPRSVFRPITVADVEPLAVKPFDGQKVRPLIDKINQQSRLLYKFSYRPAVYYEHHNVPEWVASTYQYEQMLKSSLRQLAELLDVPQERVNDFWSTWLGDDYRDIRQKSKSFFELERRTRIKHVQTYAPVVLDYLKLTGPLVPSGHAGPDLTLDTVVRQPDRTNIDRWLTDLLKRTLRRAPTKSERERYASFFDSRIAGGVPATDAIAETMTAALVSPKVVYRRQPVSGAYDGRLTSEPLDARLAAWLWIGSPAEEPPADLADSDQAIAERLDHMIGDPRFDRFADTFVRQWLRLDRVGREVIPVHDLYPKFSQHLAEDMRRECAMLVARVFREDLSLLKLIDDDRVYLNERLARHYGIPGVRGEHFRLANIDRRQAGGLLGTAAVLTATSSGVRPSPVQRGVMIAERMLGQHFGTPPPNVGSLSEDAGNSETQSLREALTAHRENASCAACHNRIDPYGFALEGFDLVGRRRARGPAGPIDDAAVTPDGVQIQGLAGLKRYIVEKRQNDFVRNLAERMLAFALGRAIDYRDEAAVRSIVRRVKQDDLSARSLLLSIALSKPFRQRDLTSALTSTVSAGDKP